MENYVTIKKKLNVPVLIILLIFAIVPGIIYFIWSRFPTKICTNPDKGHGGMLRLISTGIAFGAWLIAVCYFSALENWGIFLSFGWQLIFSLGSFLFALLTNKKTNKFFLIVNILFAVATIVVSFLLFAYNWFVSPIASIVAIVGCVKGINHYNYHKLGKGKDEDDEEDEDEDEE